MSFPNWSLLFPELRALVRLALDWRSALRLARTSREEYERCQGLYPHPAPHFIKRFYAHIDPYHWGREPAEVRTEMIAMADADLLWLPRHAFPEPLGICWVFNLTARGPHAYIGRMFDDDGWRRCYR